MFLKTLTKFTGKHIDKVSFLIKLQVSGMKFISGLVQLLQQPQRQTFLKIHSLTNNVFWLNLLSTISHKTATPWKLNGFQFQGNKSLLAVQSTDTLLLFLWYIPRDNNLQLCSSWSFSEIFRKNTLRKRSLNHH